MEELIKSMIEYNLLRMDEAIVLASDILGADWFHSGDAWYDTAVNIATTVIEPIALTIITICFLLEFLKITIQMDVLKWEYGLKCLFKFVFAKVCIDASFDLMGAIYATSASWIMSASGTTVEVTGEMWLKISDMLSGYGFTKMIGVLATVGIMGNVVMVLSIVVVVIAYARKFELLMYMAISPLPCAFLPLSDGGGMSRIPKKFFLSFAGVCLQGVMIMLAINLYYQLLFQLIEKSLQKATSLFWVFADLLMVSLVLVVAVSKCGSWAKNILDVAG